ncbi:ABC transporter substrate-binding protein [Achromobacter sp. ACRQX]|uniref:ABC transporter substrate-binding protein n=1 Tax=Achromobacter sp. ACRQX TaxID=2918181 RepID=UPI001EF3CDB3|nr:ABC transporter substrate-binding protein [Achromobacter sp. ACRQX]MCG7324159.1 ABC transporter substrate-binding protein [Achromobacter sp. ACRQX]
MRLNQLLGLLLSASVLSAAQAADITLALGTEPSTLDPQTAQDGSERAVSRNIFETLLTRTPAGELVPQLATALPRQVDATTWEVTLRPDLKFSDGKPLDAAAVAASINRIVDPKTASRQRPFFLGIKQAEAVDAVTLKVHTNGADPALPARLSWLTIVSPAAAADGSLSQKPVGSGPYVLTEWSKGNRIVLTKNPNYWNPKAVGNVDRATYRFVAEPGTRLSGLRAGDFDFITNLLPEDTKRVAQAVTLKGTDLPFVSLNALKGLTADVRVRQALNYAVDKEALANDLYGGYASVSHGQLLAPGWFGYDASIKPYPYDPKRATELLKAAGAHGKSIDLYAPSGRWLKDKELAETIAAYWEAAGLKVNFRVLAWAEYLDALNKNRVPTEAQISSSHSNQLLDADRTLSAYYAEGGVAAANDNAELKKLIEDARQEADPAKRQALYSKALQIGRDQAYLVFLLDGGEIFGLSKRVDFSPRVDGLIPLKDFRVTD